MILDVIRGVEDEMSKAGKGRERYQKVKGIVESEPPRLIRSVGGGAVKVFKY